MHSLSARRVLSACAISAASVAALLAPAAASAKGTPPACLNGANVTGQGSSFQAPEQINVWTKEFNIVSTKDFGCPGTPGQPGSPEIKYTSTGSGTALKSWGAEAPTETEPFVGFGLTNAFIATDEPPNEAQFEQPRRRGDRRIRRRGKRRVDPGRASFRGADHPPPRRLQSRKRRDRPTGPERRRSEKDL